MGLAALLVALTLLPAIAPRRQDSNASQAAFTRTTTSPGNGSTVFQPDSVKVLGTLDYGKPSASVNCSGSYSAFVFEGYGGDQVEIHVNGEHQTPFVALADSALREVTRGNSQLEVSLPDHGPAIEAWYIIFQNPDQPGQVTVEVTKTGERSKILQTQALGRTGE